MRSVAEARMAGVSQGVTLEVWEPRTVTEGPAERLESGKSTVSRGPGESV